MSLAFRTLFAIATIIILSACGFTKGKELSSKSVETFHQRLNNAQFAEIYSTATPALRSASKEADFLKFVEAVHRKLGNYKSGTQNSWNINSFNGVTSVVLTYNSDFEQGAAVETFTFVISGDSATLQGYHINSQALIIN